jgi:hypothetical protein
MASLNFLSGTERPRRNTRKVVPGWRRIHYASFVKNSLKAIVLVSTLLALISWAAQNSSSTKGSATLRASQQNPSASFTRIDPQINSESSRQTRYSSNNESLNGLQDLFSLTLRSTEKHFQGQLGLVKGFGAGSTYPQIWLRDSATVIPVSRYYYSSEYLTTWLEEHLSYQRPDGSLYDWFASGDKSNFLAGAPRAKDVYGATNRGQPLLISADKNTTEADQETSAVDAAYQVFQITGDLKWLRKTIKGQPMVIRLDRSLQYLLRARFDGRHGLLTNAFTADWGDVSPVYNNQRAIYLDEKTPLVAGLYTNVLFYRSARQLQGIYRALGQGNRAAYWQRKAENIRGNINKYLWQEDRGFYRVHIKLKPSPSGDGQDDSDLFAMGGNGLAVLYSVADDAQSARIFEVAEQRQHEFGISTIAGVLLPPYPKGFFKHPAVSEEYYYQNGGQWDWFAARFLLAEFERGDSTRAYRQLVELAEKAMTNKGLYEWHTKDGKGMGSPNYAGSAGALAGAIFQGLYGVYLNSKSLNLNIRLGDQPGHVHLYEPATGKYLTYQYSYLKESKTLKLTYESNAAGVGKICMLLPKNQQPTELRVDGESKTFGREKRGEATYGCFSTDWNTHKSELKIADSSVRKRYTSGEVPTQATFHISHATKIHRWPVHPVI